MTTPPRSSSATTSNKTALRASLKKEDESLGERLLATDVPLVAPTEPPAPAAAPERKVATARVPATPAATKPAATKPAATKPTATKPTATKPTATKPTATKPTVAKPAAAAAPVATAKALKGEKAAAKAAPSVPAAVVPAKVKAASKKTAAAVKPGAPAKPAKPQGKVEAVLSSARQEAGKKAAKLGQAVGKLEKTAQEKGDKLVRYSVDLLKSEAAAIEALRAELSKAAGWAASKSDILRAGARLFAEQKVEQMKELLAGLTAASKARKKS